MKSIEELLRNLARPDVLEFGLVTNRLPSVNVGGRFEPVDDQAPSTERLLQMLVAMGGARFVDSLSEKPVQWTTRLEGVGVIAVAAIMRKDVVQARFTVARRDPAARPATFTTTSPSAGAASAPPPPAPSTTTRDLSKSGEWEEGDDDEPTVQTLSPGQGAPKPARKPEDVAAAKPPRPTPPAPTPPDERTEERPLPAPERPTLDPMAGVDALLALAREVQASDLVVAPGRPAIARVAAESSPKTQPLAADHVERIVRAIVPARLRPTLEAAGTCDFALEHAEHGRFRANVSRQRMGPMLVLRAIARELPSLDALGLPEQVTAAIARRDGLVLVTGRPGAGKSTTLAALVDAINAGDPRVVWTIEDPIEVVHPKRRAALAQRELGTHARSWTSAVAEALASDVDVAVLGDVRSEDAARALVAACDGARLVLATIDASGPARALDAVVARLPEAERSRARGTLEAALTATVEATFGARTT